MTTDWNVYDSPYHQVFFKTKIKHFYALQIVHSQLITRSFSQSERFCYRFTKGYKVWLIKHHLAWRLTQNTSTRKTTRKWWQKKFIHLEENNVPHTSKLSSNGASVALTSALIPKSKNCRLCLLQIFLSSTIRRNPVSTNDQMSSQEKTPSLQHEKAELFLLIINLLSDYIFSFKTEWQFLSRSFDLLLIDLSWLSSFYSFFNDMSGL